MAVLNFEEREQILDNGTVVIIWQLSGKIDKSSIVELERKLQSILKMNGNYLVISCAGLSTISSDGLAMLVKYLDLFQEKDKNLLICDVSKQVKVIFDMLGLGALFRMYANVERAMKSIEKDTTPDNLSDSEMEQMNTALKQGRKIEAIKLYREFSGKDLKDAKEFVDDLSIALAEQYPDQFAKSKGCASVLVFFALSLSFLIWFI